MGRTVRAVMEAAAVVWMAAAAWEAAEATWWAGSQAWWRPIHCRRQRLSPTPPRQSRIARHRPMRHPPKPRHRTLCHRSPSRRWRRRCLGTRWMPQAWPTAASAAAGGLVLDGCRPYYVCVELVLQRSGLVLLSSTVRSERGLAHARWSQAVHSSPRGVLRVSRSTEWRVEQRPPFAAPSTSRERWTVPHRRRKRYGNDRLSKNPKFV